MGKLDIYLRVRKRRTESMYAVSRGRKVVFHNMDCDEQAVVTIEWLEKHRRKIVRRKETIIVEPNKEGEFDIPFKNTQGREYKYSAQIGRARTEDPIIYVPGKKP